MPGLGCTSPILLLSVHPWRAPGTGAGCTQWDLGGWVRQRESQTAGGWGQSINAERGGSLQYGPQYTQPECPNVSVGHSGLVPALLPAETAPCPRMADWGSQCRDGAEIPLDATAGSCPSGHWTQVGAGTDCKPSRGPSWGGSSCPPPPFSPPLSSPSPPPCLSPPPQTGPALPWGVHPSVSHTVPGSKDWINLLFLLPPHIPSLDSTCRVL